MKYIYYICLTVVAAAAPGSTKQVTMEKNKAVIRQLYEEVLNEKKMDVLKGLVSDEYVGPRGEKGVAAFTAQIAGLISAFPDIHYTIEDLMAEDNKVAIRWTWQGTHTAAFTTIAPTGKTISNEGMAIYECRDGKIIKAQFQTDRLGFLQQLEIIPINPAAAAAKSAPRFIDKFTIPAAAKEEFLQRMNLNRSFIKIQPGFIKDEAYSCTDDSGNLICITIAEWESIEALNKAKEAVQAEYKKEGFNPAEMMKRLEISMDRGIYTRMGD